MNFYSGRYHNIVRQHKTYQISMKPFCWYIYIKNNKCCKNGVLRRYRIKEYKNE